MGINMNIQGDRQPNFAPMKVAKNIPVMLPSVQPVEYRAIALPLLALEKTEETWTRSYELEEYGVVAWTP